MSDLLMRIRKNEEGLSVRYATVTSERLPMDDPLVADVVTFVRRVAAAGAEADVTLLDQSTVRSDLARIIHNWSRRLELLVGRPVIEPELAEFNRPDLMPIRVEEVQALLIGSSGPSTDQPGRVLQLDGRHLRDALLRDSDFRDFVLIDCHFERVDLRRSAFGPKTVLTRTRFESCPMQGVRATGAAPDGADMDIAQFDDDELGGLRASSCVFDGCTFMAADFKGATFSYCVFQNARFASGQESDRMGLELTAFTACTLTGVQFLARLDKATFTDCEMDRTSFERAQLMNAVFSQCSLVGADFSGADLTGATFTNCDLRDASFGVVRRSRRGISSKTRTDGTNFTRSTNLSAAQLRTVDLDQWTRVPPDIVNDLRTLRPDWQPAGVNPVVHPGLP